MINLCVVCGKPLTGKQTVLCSDRECYRKRDAERKRKECQNNREKINKRRRKNYQNNPKESKEHKYYLNNREKILERNHEYQQNKPEMMKENARRYYQNNRERMKENTRRYYQNNRERILKKKKEYDHKNYWNNPKIFRELGRKNYRRSRGLPEDWDLSKESSIETIMKEWLQESDIGFIQQYTINFENATWTHVDFYIPEANVCLYVDGDYWHSLPERKECDIRINKALEEMGHGVLRMTESEILEGSRPWWIGELISSSGER